MGVKVDIRRLTSGWDFTVLLCLHKALLRGIFAIAIKTCPVSRGAGSSGD